MDFTHLDSLVKALDVLATFVFALVGARVAADRGLDYGGITFIAVQWSKSWRCEWCRK